VPYRPPLTAAPTASHVIYANGPSPVTVENSARSVGAAAEVAALGGQQLYLRYALGGARIDAPFVAFAFPAPEIARFTGVRFTALASRPMRLSVQLRAAAEQGSERWRRSVYLDDTPRVVTLLSPTSSRCVTVSPPRHRWGHHRSAGGGHDQHGVGSNGEIWLDDVAFVR
jgi:hypothetical protein